MFFFTVFQRNCLRNKIICFSWLAVIVRPAVNLWYLSFPVTMARINRCGPLECSRAPWVHCCHFTAAVYADNKVDNEQDLCKEHDHSHDAYEAIDALEVFERLPCRVIVITAWHTRDTFVVHRPEDKVRTGESDEEVDIAQCIVHEPAKHLREPVVDTGEHTKEGRHTHYYMEVRHNEVSIVQVDVNSGVTKEYTCKTT